MKGQGRKWASLLVLVVQNCSLILIMRYSRTLSAPEDMYISSTAVVFCELLKFLISAVYLYTQEKSKSDFISHIISDISTHHIEFLKLLIPSGLYVIQNNLQYIAATNLSAPMFQLLSQLKIVTTAIFFVLLLSRKLSIVQWGAIVALSAGVALVQYQSDSSGSSGNQTIGIICVILSSMTSGFSGVYFEMILKSGTLTLWQRNMHLSLIGLILSTAVCLVQDMSQIASNGFLHGYNGIVVIVILLQAAGGIVVSVVVMYADNVLKGFATSASLIISCLLSSMLLEPLPLTPTFVLGAGLVAASAFAYSYFPYKPTSLPSIVSPRYRSSSDSYDRMERMERRRSMSGGSTSSLHSRQHERSFEE